MVDVYNAGVEAAAKVMDDLDGGGWFAEAIRARARRVQQDDIDVIDGMVAAAAAHLGIERRPDDPDIPAVRRCMEAILARLRADGVVR